MTPNSVSSLLDALRAHSLLESEQLAEVSGRLQKRFTEPRGLTKELVQRGWLTPYQANQLFLGRGEDLRLGNYVLLERLGEGAMGQVFKARHQKIGSLVALKLIRRDRLASPRAVERFRREIQAAAKLSHPNIVLALDAGEIGGTHFYTMEYVEGQDLARLVKEKGPVPVWQACDYIRQAALGLQHAFENGVVHRDVKPGNLLLATLPPAKGTGGAGRAVQAALVKILDMGLARLLDASGGSASPALTQLQSILGTPDYMSPEQAKDSRSADIRSDLYSLGCTFYFLLAGRQPFPGGQPTDKMLKHWLEEAEPVEQARRRQIAEVRKSWLDYQPGDPAEVPPAVADIVRKMMAKKREDRYQTPAEVVSALTPLLPTGIRVVSLPAPAPRKRRQRRWFWLAGVGALFLGLAGLLFAFGLRARLHPPAATPLTPEASAQELRALRARCQDPSADRGALRRELLAFAGAHPGSDLGREAAELVMPLPSPLDDLKAEDIPAEERIPGQPKNELVAVLGQHQARHWGPVQSVAFSPDGKWLASGGRDALVRLWDLATGQVGRVLPGHTTPVSCVAFSPDGQWLAAGAGDATVRVWDVRSGAEKVTLKGHAGPVVALAFGAGGKALAVRGRDKKVELWDLTPAADGSLPKGAAAKVTCEGLMTEEGPLAFAPDGKVACGDAALEAGQMIRVWYAGARAADFDNLPAAVLSLAYAPTGRALAAGYANGTVQLLDPAAQRFPREIATGHKGGVVALAFTRDSRTLVTAGRQDRSVRCWDMAEAKDPVALEGPREDLLSVAVTADGKTVAAGGADGGVYVWDVATKQESPGFHRHLSSGGAVAFAPDGETLAWVTDGTSVELWDAVTRRRRGRLGPAPAPLTALAFTPDGAALVLGCEDRTVKRWPLEEGKAGTALAGHEKEVTGVAVAPAGALAASASGDHTARLWDLAGARPHGAPLEHKGAVRAVAFAPRCDVLASGGEESVVHLWGVAEAREQGTLPVLKGGLTALAYSPDGALLAGGGDNSGVWLWDVAGGSLRGELKGQRGGVSGVAFLPDGRTLVSVGPDGRIFFWDPASLQKRHEWQLPGALRGLAVAPDGRHVVTANANGTVYILRLGPLPAAGK